MKVSRSAALTELTEPPSQAADVLITAINIYYLSKATVSRQVTEHLQLANEYSHTASWSRTWVQKLSVRSFFTHTLLLVV